MKSHICARTRNVCTRGKTQSQNTNEVCQSHMIKNELIEDSNIIKAQNNRSDRTRKEKANNTKMYNAINLIRDRSLTQSTREDIIIYTALFKLNLRDFEFTFVSALSL